MEPRFEDLQALCEENVILRKANCQLKNESNKKRVANSFLLKNKGLFQIVLSILIVFSYLLLLISSMV